MRPCKNYCRFIFVLQLGIMVCDCSWRHWAFGTGVVACKVLECTLFLLRKVKPTCSDNKY